MLAMDAVWLVGLTALIGLSAAAAFFVAGLVPGPLGWGLAVCAGLLTWIAATTLIAWLLPRPKPGRHPLMGDASFFLWVFGLVVRRWLDLPPMGLLWRQSNLARFVVLRACGAKVRLSTSISSDAVLLDPNLLVLGPRVVIGSEAVITGHYMTRDVLMLAAVEIGAGTEIGAQVSIGPGARIGAGVRVEPRANIGNDAVIGDGAVVGFLATVHPWATVAAGERVAPHAVVTVKRATRP